MRALIAFVLTLAASSMAAAQSVGDKIAQFGCVPQAMYQLSPADLAAYNAGDVSGVYRPDANTERWFYKAAGHTLSGPHCVLRNLSANTCQSAPMTQLQNVIAMTGPWSPAC